MFKRMHKISCSDFWVLSHERLSDFYTSAWQRRGSPLPLLFFRLVLAAASVGFLVWSLTSGQSGLSPLWLIYLTNWGLVMVTAMAVSGFFVSAMIACKRPADDEKTPWYVGLFWIIFNVTQTIAIAITVLYWTLLYDANTMVYATTAAFWLDVAVHGFNSVISVGELVISRTPVRWLHVYQPLLVAAVYVAFIHGFNSVISVELVVSRTPVRWLHVYQPLLVAAVYVAFIHGFNSVISIELVVSRTPVRWLHVYQPLLVAAVYVAFTPMGSYYHIWVNVAVHGFNSVISVELVVYRTPVRWLHVYQPLLERRWTYVAFIHEFNSVISVGELVVSRTPAAAVGIMSRSVGSTMPQMAPMNRFGEPFIYPVLNWNEPGMAGAVSGGSLLGVFVVHTLVWALALGRNKLSDILFQRQTHELPHTHDKA
ncbi:hypothetical protein MSG28_011172 [Choristoneura fumiferana]|uniref:Uncharacterized protein n=1 Tax=Choristoneura fumiferana TaxID=7141 RepID=A0ACC0KQP8_CHOFU|nr:hypothetical protein MSG28_011172 [Choristoneura fumiferana]